MSDTEPTYRVIRFYADETHPHHGEIIRERLTLSEARAHCQRDDTHVEGVWFDGYTEERS